MLDKPTPASSLELVAIGLVLDHRGQDVVAMFDYYDRLSKPV